MQTITSVRAMQRWSDEAHRRGRRIGLVPTMGYLHAGHLSLVAEARKHADLIVASIFVNPLQFGANEDLDRYPSDIERDTRLLTEAGTDVLFLPPAREMYPDGFQTTVAVDGMTRGLCGIGRPTHFRGVTTVVAKLFNAVKPHVAVFGEKDYQQLVVIRRLAADLNFDVDIVGAPIVREEDGLAMSSRNAYLSAAEREAGRCLSQALAAARAAVEDGETDAARVLERARAVVDAEPLAHLEYASVVDADSLAELARIDGPARLALAVHVGKTRLIDNCLLESPKSKVERSKSAGGARR
jgi:pantoate--beta-alanine ligase